jgi:peptidylprolyl isomerase
MGRPRNSLLRYLYLLAATMLIAGCGSSGGSNTIGIGNENKADSAVIKPVKKSCTRAGGSRYRLASSIKTPTTGPLSKEPKVTPPRGPAPKKLEIKDLIRGTGREVKAGGNVVINYVMVAYKSGKGNVVLSSWEDCELTTASLKTVIPGWSKGIPGMKVGGRRELVIPAALAFGEQRTGSIPSEATMVAVIDLLGI